MKTLFCTICDGELLMRERFEEQTARYVGEEPYCQKCFRFNVGYKESERPVIKALKATLLPQSYWQVEDMIIGLRKVVKTEVGRP